MIEHTNQNLSVRLEKAKKILLDKEYFCFEKLISDYKVSYNSPLWDVACFLTYLELPDKSNRKQKWVEFWNKFSQKRYYKNLVYAIPSTYLHLSDLRKAKLFFVKFLEQSAYNTKKIDWDNFLSLFFQFKASIKPSMSKREFSIFQAILDKQTMQISELSRNLGIDKSNISRYKKALNSKKIVHQGISLNYHKLNLNVNGILFEYPIHNTVNIFSKLSDSVFFHSVYTSNVGYKTALSYFVTPTSPQAEKDIHRLSTKICLEESIPSYTIFRFLTETRMKSFNFNFYDYKKGEWNINPIHLQFTLQDFESNLEGYVPIITTDFEKSDYQKLKLNKTGLDILNHILAKRHMSAREIKQDLNLTEKTTQKLVQYLKKNEMYKLRFNPSYIFGLKNVVLFLETSSRNQSKIHKTFSLFPEVYSEQYSSDNGEGIYFVLRIPNELVVDSIETLTNSYNDKLEYLFIVDQMYTKRYQLPSERFETVFQEWKYDSEDILGG